ncbi:MAG: hypothetical protein CMI80_01080 [Candidatus Pelagibacter sp.]|nr:hypothetical protein [Candidatus Pelagibacter sp.]
MILCNGLIRILSNKYNNYYLNLFCRSKHLKIIKFMYRDNKKIKLIPLKENRNLLDEKLLMKYEGKFIENYIKKKNIKKRNLISIGFENYDKIKNLNKDKKNQWPCDIIFYKQFNIPFKKRFTETYWRRDKKNEKKLYKKLIKKNEKFAFIHDDPKRNIYLKNNFLNKKIKKIVKNDVKENIFNYGMILEKADEIHIMESSIRQIIEVLKIKSKKIFLYKGRGGEHDANLYNNRLKKYVGTSKKWTIIKNGIVNKKLKRNIFEKFKNKMQRPRQKLIYLRSIKNL